jgi:uncharacterized protein
MSAKFHFSPRPNRANEINWRDWGEDAFQEAREANKPVLLSLSAVWCHWCHVMDETSYSNESIISFINERFIPVRVDNDQRPDVNARYNMGGWPTTAFLTPDGEILAGATYVPPEQMLEALPKVYTHFVSNGAEVAEKALELRERRRKIYTAGKGELSPAILEGVVRSVVNAYDPLYGGLGEAPKFPHTDSLDLLLYAHRRLGDPDVLHIARKTLEVMFAGEIYDREWNGFFRYATRRDWSEPHYEKMLQDNAGLLHDACTLYRITRDDSHAEIARGVVAYVNWKLHDEERGFFYGSQDADEEFYKLPAEEREAHEEPYIDRTCYVSWNAEMISAYLEASWTLGHDELRDMALRALDFMWNECLDTASGSMYRYHDGEPHVTGLLADQAQVARALLDASEATGDSTYIDRAITRAELMDKRFRDTEHGGFWDVWDEVANVGRLAERQKSVQDNAVCSEVFLRLGHLTRNQRYVDIARETAEAFAATAEQMGYFASGYAKVVDLVLNPPSEVNIVAPSERADDFVKAAVTIDAPYRIVQVLDPDRDVERLEALSLPAEPSPAAYICVGTACSAPVHSPGEIAQVVREMREAAGRRITLDD